jgi:dimeric dUTPase (all-alpha-NTP-PPase superfamily)
VTAHAQLTLDDLLEHQRLLQLGFGNDLTVMPLDARCEFIKDMVLAATDELHELLNEIHWKPWSSADPFINLDYYRGELVDVLHFVLNLALAAGLTGEEIERAYIAKAGVNRKRQAAGYTNDGKCEVCGRAADEPR